MTPEQPDLFGKSAQAGRGGIKKPSLTSRQSSHYGRRAPGKILFAPV